MNAIDVQPPVTESQRLYSHWRAARARWDLAQYDRPNPQDDLPDELDAMHCATEHGALRAYLLCPTTDSFELARKLRVMQTEGAAHFDCVGEVIEVLAKDAHTIAEEQHRHRVRGKPVAVRD